MIIKFKPEVEKKIQELLDGLRELGIDTGNSVYIKHIQDSKVMAIGSYLPIMVSHIEGEIRFVIPDEMIENEI